MRDGSADVEEVTIRVISTRDGELGLEGLEESFRRHE